MRNTGRGMTFLTQPTLRRLRFASLVSAAAMLALLPVSAQDGQWNHRILLATSTDGFNWTIQPDVLAERASVPELFLNPDGRPTILVVDAAGPVNSQAKNFPRHPWLEADDGRLWFATIKGIAAESSRVGKNRHRPRPAVVISGIISNEKTHPAANRVKLPARTENLETLTSRSRVKIHERRSGAGFSLLSRVLSRPPGPDDSGR